MTSSQWLDIAVLVVAFIAAISGWRSGALGSLMSFVGVVLGAIAGVMLAPHIVGNIHSPRAKLFAALFLILALVVIGEVAGDIADGAVVGIADRGSVTADQRGDVISSISQQDGDLRADVAGGADDEKLCARGDIDRCGRVCGHRCASIRVG